ncbi:MAG: DUF58 domain-containing protein [Spirochaetales bacterium]|nr:DUF58 domain-containing protein [Spirochaetales bacterium]
MWFFLSLCCVFFEFMVWLWLALGLILLIITIIDVIALFTLKIPQMRRSVPHALSLGVPAKVEIIITTIKPAPSQVQIFDHHPPGFHVQGLPRRISFSASKQSREYRVSYGIKPVQRGNMEFALIDCLMRSPFGIWHRRVFCGHKNTVRVYPNFRAVSRYTLLAVAGKVEQLGIRKQQRRGQGSEFHQLREYIPGDSVRLIDWKITSKYHKLICRQYQEEQDQQIVFLLDCGFRMHTKDGELSHFDSALNALILLAYVALKQGDSIGLMTFGGQKRWLAPRRGISTLNHILNTVYDLDTSLSPSDIAGAIEDVIIHLRRRTLIILVTNIREEDTENLISTVQTAKKRHLILTASVQETVLKTSLATKIRTFSDSLKNSSIYTYLNVRAESTKRLKAAGALYFDEIPEKLPAALVNRYLDIKTKGLL